MPGIWTNSLATAKPGNINAALFLVDDNAALLIWDVRCSRTWNGNLPQTMYLSANVGCGMRLHASSATHTPRSWEEEVYFIPHMCKESFNLWPRFWIYYTFFHQAGFIMYLHRLCLCKEKINQCLIIENASKKYVLWTQNAGYELQDWWWPAHVLLEPKWTTGSCGKSTDDHQTVPRWLEGGFPPTLSSWHRPQI